MGCLKKCGGCCLVLIPIVAVLLGEAQRRLWYRVLMDCSRPEIPLIPAQDAANYEMMNVVYSSDLRNFPGLLSGMISLARHLGEPEKCTIHIIVPAKDLAGAEDLMECFKREVSAPPAVRAIPKVQLHATRPVPLNLEKLSDGLFTHLVVNDQLWSQFYIADYLPGERRALWLDTDTIVVTDIAPYYRMQMKHVFAASPESRHVAGAEPGHLKTWHRTADHAHNVTEDTYFNAGILLIDLERWRREAVSDLLKQWFSRTHSDATNSSLLVSNQLVLNLAFQGGNLDLVDWRWNLLGMGAPIPVPKLCVQEAHIFHFYGCLGFEVDNRKYWHKNRPGHCRWNEYVIEPYLPKQACSALP